MLRDFYLCQCGCDFAATVFSERLLNRLWVNSRKILTGKHWKNGKQTNRLRIYLNPLLEQVDYKFSMHTCWYHAHCKPHVISWLTADCHWDENHFEPPPALSVGIVADGVQHSLLCATAMLSDHTFCGRICMCSMNYTLQLESCIALTNESSMYSGKNPCSGVAQLTFGGGS